MAASPESAPIAYTLDGTIPLDSPTTAVYTGPIRLTTNTVLTAVAVTAGVVSDLGRVRYLRRL